MRRRKKNMLTRAKPVSSMREEVPRGKISGELRRDLAALKQEASDSADLVTRLVHTVGNHKAALVYYANMTDLAVVSQNVLRPLQSHDGTLDSRLVAEQVISVPNVAEENDIQTIVKQLGQGAIAVLLDGQPCALQVTSAQVEHRDIGRSESEDVLIGPHDSFAETLSRNLAVMRWRLSSPDLKIRQQTIGRYSQTEVAILYLKGVAQEKLVAEVEQRLSRINIDAINGAAYLTDFLEDNPFSTFPQLRVTERPSRVVAALAEGRIVIMANGDPTALIIPTFLPEFLQSSEDYYDKPLVGSFLRLLRLVSLMLAIFLPGIWISLVGFHHGIIPPPLFMSIVAGREGVPLPTVLEAFVLLFAFDVVVEASTRMPFQIGQAIGIVGAIILGQAAVQAGLVSPAMVIVVALAGLAAFTQPSPAIVGPIRVLKYAVLAVASVLGLYGVVWAFLFLVIQAASLRSFGYPYLFPLGPFNLWGEMDILLRLPNFWLTNRPRILAGENPQRQQPLAMPSARKDGASEE